MTEPDIPDIVENPPATLAQSEHEDEGRIGYGRYARYSPIGLALLIALIVGGGWWWQSRDDSAGTSTFVGKPMPALTLTTFNGNTVDLQELKGSIVVINFWAAWCEPCTEEMPVFQDVYEQTMETGEPVVFLGVNLKTDRQEDALKLLSDLGITYITGHDAGGDDPLHGPIQEAFGIPDSYPSTLFIRPDGTVDSFRIGIISETELRERMKAAAS